MFQKVFEYAGPHKKGLYAATAIVLVSVLLGVFPDSPTVPMRSILYLFFLCNLPAFQGKVLLPRCWQRVDSLYPA